MSDSPLASSEDPNLPLDSLLEHESGAESPTSQPADAVSLEHVIAVVQQLQADFQAKIQYDQSKDRTIDSLHRELQGYREDLALKILSPIVKDVVQLFDDLEKLTAHKSGDESGDRVREELRNYLLMDIESLLERHGFELYESTEVVFDRKLHRVTRVVTTPNAALDLNIVERVRRGIRYGERIIRPESVVVYQYKTSENNESA